MKIKTIQLRTVILITLFIISGIFLAYRPVFDTDFGWHLRVGEYILRTRSIPYTDLFSFSVPHYPYVYHSWLTEVLMYISYRLFGWWGVSLLYSLVFTGISALLSKITALSTGRNVSFFTPLVLIPALIITIGFRTQSISALLLTALIYLLTSSKIVPVQKDTFFAWTKQANMHWVLIILTLWINLHGGFVLGFGFLILYLLMMIVQQMRSSQFGAKSFAYPAVTILLIITSMTVLNPYGVRSWEQAIQMANNPVAAAENVDWQPIWKSIQNYDQYYLLPFFLSGLFFVAMSVQNSKKGTPLKITAVLFFLLLFESRRYMFPFLIVISPFLVSLIQDVFAYALDKNRTYKFPYIIALSVLFISLISNSLKTQLFTYCAYTNKVCYAEVADEHNPPPNFPVHATAFMKEYGVPTHLFNHANWGGYLIYAFPEHRFFYDGRMDNFFNNGESFLAEYLSIQHAQGDWKEKLEQYDINGVLGAPNWELVHELKNDSDWNVVYENETSILLEKISD
ncbi:hypothetical protein KC571_02775 [candidate division WWE3 bacterium]|uniref:Uncharacterized protein n=1 Tax=candidate division WWE3 bacterium TaxID=2053526 RepID=A0A955LI93_UNCKA|nr:hypothetical protein [candidate division WWE3 bacterium]